MGKSAKLPPNTRNVASAESLVVWRGVGRFAVVVISESRGIAGLSEAANRAGSYFKVSWCAHGVINEPLSGGQVTARPSPR